MRVGRGGGGLPPMMSLALGLLEGRKGAEVENERRARQGMADDRVNREESFTQLKRDRDEGQRTAQQEARARLAADEETQGLYGSTDDAFDESFDYLDAEREEKRLRSLRTSLEAMGFSAQDAALYARTGKDPKSEREYNAARAAAQRATAARQLMTGQTGPLDRQIATQKGVLDRTTRTETAKIPTKRPFEASAMMTTPTDSSAFKKWGADSAAIADSADARIGRESTRLDALRNRRNDFTAMGFPAGTFDFGLDEMGGEPDLPDIGMPAPRIPAPGAPAAPMQTSDPEQAAVAAKLQQTIATILQNPMLDDQEKARRVQMANETVMRALQARGARTP